VNIRADAGGGYITQGAQQQLARERPQLKLMLPATSVLPRTGALALRLPVM